MPERTVSTQLVFQATSFEAVSLGETKMGGKNFRFRETIGETLLRFNFKNGPNCGKRYNRVIMKKNLDDLDDHIWIEATRTVVEFGQELEHALGRKPTCDEYCLFLARAFQGTHRDLFSDVSTASVIQLKAVLAKVPDKILPGTLIGIPSGKGGVFAIVYLTSNRFGDAFGILKGSFSRLRMNSIFEPTQSCVYSSLRPLREGRWKRLGIRSDLISMFPDNPEIYHRKTGRNLENASIGRFGSAETAAGELRNISEEEAASEGLLSIDYHQFLTEKQFVTHLQLMAKI